MARLAALGAPSPCSSALLSLVFGSGERLSLVFGSRALLSLAQGVTGIGDGSALADIRQSGIEVEGGIAAAEEPGAGRVEQRVKFGIVIGCHNDSSSVTGPWAMARLREARARAMFCRTAAWSRPSWAAISAVFKPS